MKYVEVSYPLNKKQQDYLDLKHDTTPISPRVCSCGDACIVGFPVDIPSFFFTGTEFNDHNVITDTYHWYLSPKFSELKPRKQG